MNRMWKALGAFALTLVLALSLAISPFCAPAQAAQAEEEFAGYLVMLQPQAETASLFSLEPMAQATLMAAESERQELLPLSEDLGIYKADDLSDIQNLVWSGQVAVAEPDYKAELFGAPDLASDHNDPTKPDDPYFIDEDFNYQFNLKDEHGIHVRAAWDAGLTGDGVTVAVIDSGLNFDHVDTPAKVARGRYYFYREEADGRYQFVIGGVTRYYNFYSNDNVVDDMGHGSMVSGIIAAQKDNGTGIAGIAPNVTLMPIKCFTAESGCLGGYISNLIGGITYAMENGAQIINMSWGIRNVSAVLEATITQAANAGCILIAAVGNDGASTLQYPAAYENVIGVGSTNKQGGLSNFSQRNSSVAVCAPGGSSGGNQIWSLSYNDANTIGKGDGTSFSAPMVAASAALLKEALPTMTQADFLQLLPGNCDEVPDSDDYVGCGIINLEKLLDAVGYAGGLVMARSGDSVTFRSAYHPVQSATQPPEGSILMIGAYNAKGHLLDSVIAAPTLSGYGAYSLLAKFDDPNIATLRAFYLKDGASLAAAADPAEIIIRS